MRTNVPASFLSESSRSSGASGILKSVPVNHGCFPWEEEDATGQRDLSGTRLLAPLLPPRDALSSPLMDSTRTLRIAHHGSEPVQEEDSGIRRTQSILCALRLNFEEGFYYPGTKSRMEEERKGMENQTRALQRDT
ncbi:hypothetical protein CapIbe_015897 [Capra ibex]